MPDKLFKVDIKRKVEAVFIDSASLMPPRRVAKHLSDIGDGKFDPVFLERVREAGPV